MRMLWSWKMLTKDFARNKKQNSGGGNDDEKVSCNMFLCCFHVYDDRHPISGVTI